MTVLDHLREEDEAQTSSLRDAPRAVLSEDLRKVLEIIRFLNISTMLQNT